MKIPPDAILLCEQVSSTAWERAYAFHQSQALQDENLWLRSDVEIEEFAKRGRLFGTHWCDSNSFVGLCYVRLTSDEREWELGGLTVAKDARHLGIGQLLIRVIIAHTTALDFPQLHGRAIIAHVRTTNERAQQFLSELGFVVHTDPVVFTNAPTTMRGAPGGDVVAYKFMFPKDGLCQLETWFKEFNDTLPNGVKVQIDLGEIRPEDLKEALIEAVRILDLHCNS
jgi:ribosomal protein S18 acetylase RimI-like enzyme